MLAVGAESVKWTASKPFPQGGAWESLTLIGGLGRQQPITDQPQAGTLVSEGSKSREMHRTYAAG